MNKIELRRGRSAVIEVPVKYSDGSDLILDAEDTVRFAVRSSADGEVLISKTMDYDSTENKVSLTLEPADTASLELGHYFYDIGIDFLDETFYDLVEWSEFELLPSASQDGGAQWTS